MQTRLTEVFAQKEYSSDTTEIIDLNIADPLSALLIQYDVYNSANGSMDGSPAKSISKVEIVDGSDTIVSLSGEQIEALDFYDNKIVRTPCNIALTGNYTRRWLYIPFGRFPGDMQLALDPAKFQNLQLKITVDIGSGGITNTKTKVKVGAFVFDELQVQLTGFLMSKEIKQWTLSASGHEYTDMPLDYPYRKIFLQQHEEGMEPTQNIQNVKFSEDNDKRIPFNQASDMLLAWIQTWCPQYLEHWYCSVANSARYVMCSPTNWVGAVAAQWRNNSEDINYALYAGAGGRLKTIHDAGEEDNSQIIVNGCLPHGVWAIPAFIKDEPGMYYDVTRIQRTLRADIEATSAADGTEIANLFLQQYRHY